jgi:hypothetical protein
MKSIAALALIGAVSSVELSKLNNQHKMYVAMQLDDDMLIQTEKILEKTADSNTNAGWSTNMNGFPGTINDYGNYMDAYNREMPERFVGDAAQEDVVPVDKFTQNLIANYAQEGTSGGDHPKPTGHFYITKAQSHSLAEEILCTHFKTCGAEASKWLDDASLNRFEHAWEYFDVLKAGKVDAVGSSTFFRYLVQPLGWLDI